MQPAPPLTSHFPVFLALFGGGFFTLAALFIVLAAGSSTRQVSDKTSAKPPVSQTAAKADTNTPTPLGAVMFSQLPEKLQGTWEMTSDDGKSFTINLRVLSDGTAAGNFCVATPQKEVCPSDKLREITFQASGSAALAEVLYRDPETQIVQRASLSYDDSDDRVLWFRDPAGTSEFVPVEALMARAATPLVPEVPFTPDSAYMVGTWHVQPFPGEAWSHTFHFYPSGRFRYRAPENECAGPVVEQWGTWTVSAARIELQVLREKLRDVVSDTSTAASCAGKTEVVAVAEPRVINLQVFPLYLYPIDPRANPHPSVLIATERFWKISADPSNGSPEFGEPDLEKKEESEGGARSRSPETSITPITLVE